MEGSMLRLAKVALLAGAMTLGLTAGASAQADKPLTILESVPGLTFPFFVHMMNQMKAEAEKLGNITVIESDGQVSSPKQTADIEAAITQGVDGIVISPNEVDAMARRCSRRSRPISGGTDRSPCRCRSRHSGPCRCGQRQGWRGAG
jgi:ribose transport system substrate-binding protein/inositol transport system substrate-binding protein